jgi:large subunit ribosomal protein L6e
MVKTKEQLNKARKERRNRLKTDSAKYKLSKNWYPTSDAKNHFKRTVKVPKAPTLSKDIQPGQVLILLSGRFRGRRVIFLKQTTSGLLLVTGPYKLNGVPLKRVNRAYVIATKTKITLPNLPGLDKINDDTFTERVKVERTAGNFFEEPAKKKERITEKRRTAQTNVDVEITKVVKATPYLKEYLQNRFALKNNDKPHLMEF